MNETENVATHKKDTSKDKNTYFKIIHMMNTARRSLLMYPPGHDEIKQNCKTAFATLSAFFKNNTEISIQILKNKLEVEGEALDLQQTINSEFQSSLRELNFSKIIIRKNLQENELNQFLNYISPVKPDDKKDTILKNIKINCPNIDFQIVDYSGLGLTVETEILKSEPGETRNKEIPVNSSYMEETEYEPPVYAIDDEPEPEKATSLLTRSEQKIVSSVEDYEKNLESYFQDNKKKDALVDDPKAKLKIIRTFLQKLSPKLKQQFQSYNFDEILSEDSLNELEKLLDDDEANRTLEMLRQANEEDREISPTLIGLVKKMLLTSNQKITELQNIEIENTKDGDKKPQSEIIEDLFEREDYEKFIATEYDQTIKKLTTTSPEGFGPKSFPIEDYLKTFNENHLYSQIGKAIMSLLTDTLTNEKEYPEYLNGLMIVTDMLLSYGDFQFLMDCFELFRTEYKRIKDPSLKNSLKKCYEHIQSPQYIRKATEIYDIQQHQENPSALAFLFAVGSSIIPEIIHLYCWDKNPEKMAYLLPILKDPKFIDDTQQSIQNLIENRTDIPFGNLIFLIGQLGDNSFTPILKKWLDHDDPIIRARALYTLLQFKDPMAIETLGKFIRSGNKEDSENAIIMAGEYKINDAIPDLISELERSFFFMRNFWKKNTIIKALGKIGDPLSINALGKIAQKKWNISPKKLQDLKITLFQSLEGYPYDSIQDILTIGENLQDKLILSIVEKLHALNSR